jgi:hypothetical protein
VHDEQKNALLKDIGDEEMKLLREREFARCPHSPRSVGEFLVIRYGMVFFIVLMSLVSIVFSAGHNGSRALVTLAIGDRYRDMFERHCRSNWSVYAERHGCDLIVIDTPIDRTERAFARSLHWQKCLILEHEQVENYRQVAGRRRHRYQSIRPFNI